MDLLRYEQTKVAQHQTLLQARAPLGSLPTEYCGILEQILTATHCGTIAVHSRSGRLYLIVEQARAFMSAEGDISVSYSYNEPSGLSYGGRPGGVRISVTREAQLLHYALEGLPRASIKGKYEFPQEHGALLASEILTCWIPFPGGGNNEDVISTIRAAQTVSVESGLFLRDRFFLGGNMLAVPLQALKPLRSCT